MKKKKTHLICLVAFLFLITFNVNFVESKIELIDLSHPKHLRILDEFDKGNEWVPTIVEIHSTEVMEDVIASLSGIEIKNIRRLYGGVAFSGEITLSGINKLANNSDVVTINLEEELRPLLDKSVQLINATIVWDLNYSGKDQTICVIDTGVNASHPDLQGKVLAEKCYCSYPEGNNSDCCPDGTLEDDDAEDSSGHGTHVTGIIVSQDLTYTGVAPNASVVVVKVCNSTESCVSSDVFQAITWCRNNAATYNISIITLSLGSGIYTSNSCPDWADSTINAAVGAGIFVDASSGNEFNTTGINYPACSPNVTSVGASTDLDTMAHYTNREVELLDLLAPGSSI